MQILAHFGHSGTSLNNSELTVTWNCSWQLC